MKIEFILLKHLEVTGKCVKFRESSTLEYCVIKELKNS